MERLDAGLAGGSRLTLVSAPAGFGKTTLVSEWAAGCGRPVAWLSLDTEDGDPGRFLAYLVAALRTVALGLGEGVLALLQSPELQEREARWSVDGANVLVPACRVADGPALTMTSPPARRL